MTNQGKPILSIGLIFKNEIRCIERCLKSLQPLRDMVFCELIMADTGSTDGSRQVAEKYADLVFDFPWINDFAAARNAVMERCSGKWYMSIDCDEWIGGDVSELAEFVRTDSSYDYGGITVRNYQTPDLENGGEYADFTACRLLRMSTGLRYVGAIHERWPAKSDGTQHLLLMARMFLHHDGYLYISPEAAKSKHDRNMALLQKKMEADPGNLLLLMQCIESSEGTAAYMDYIAEAVQGIKEKRSGWEMFGASILRYAAVAAYKNGLPEIMEYVEMAQQLFPSSMFTRIDTEYAAFGTFWNQKNYTACIQSGKKYLAAVSDFTTGKHDYKDTLCSTVLMWSPSWQIQVSIFLAASYLYEKQPWEARQVLNNLDGRKMAVKHVGDCVRVYSHLHSRSWENTAPLITKLWEEICRPTPSGERAEQRKTEFIRMASEVFLPAYQKDEQGREDFCRHAYTLFLPLEGKCVLGDAATMLETEDSAALTELLEGVRDLEQLPIHVLYHALDCGAAFPAKRRVKLEEMEALAGRLAQDREKLFQLATRSAEPVSQNEGQALTWRCSLVMAAVRTHDWKSSEEGFALARVFAAVEQSFLPACYAPSMRREENVNLLPPMHRFGWYLPQAFQALDGEDAIGYTRILRKGLSVCEGMKPMVEFLLEHTPELQTQPEPSAELKALADQIRTILANYSPDDPAVAELKQSEAYQKVAYMIEGAEPPVAGNMCQRGNDNGQ